MLIICPLCSGASSSSDLGAGLLSRMVALSLPTLSCPHLHLAVKGGSSKPNVTLELRHPSPQGPSTLRSVRRDAPSIQLLLSRPPTCLPTDGHGLSLISISLVHEAAQPEHVVASSCRCASRPSQASASGHVSVGSERTSCPVPTLMHTAVHSLGCLALPVLLASHTGCSAPLRVAAGLAAA